MTEKKIEIDAKIVARKSPDFQEINYKAKAGLTEAEAIERNTVGSFGDSREGEDEETDV